MWHNLCFGQEDVRPRRKSISSQLGHLPCDEAMQLSCMLPYACNTATPRKIASAEICLHAWTDKRRWGSILARCCCSILSPHCIALWKTEVMISSVVLSCRQLKNHFDS